MSLGHQSTITGGESGERKSFWIAVAAVACLGVFIVGFDLNGYRTLTKHEGFIAVVSREMLQTGDWIVPRFGGIPRLKKPPLGYWCAASVSGILGTHAPWTSRLPFAMSGLALAALVGVWAGTWYGRWSGLCAAIVQLTSVYFISFSRKAEVDMLLCLLTTAALFLVAHSSQNEARKPRAFRWIGIYALVGLAWLAKFHYGPAMVLAVVVVWHVVDQRRPGFWDVFNPVGLCILAAAIVIWPWLLLRQVPEAWSIWQTETIGRAFGELGREPVWFYVPQVFLLALPWSLLLWRAGTESFHRAWKAGERREQFLWVWFLTQFAILSMTAFKHHHYLMAAMPAICLILGRTLKAVWSECRGGSLRFAGKHAIYWGAAFCIGGVVVAVEVSREWPHLTNAAVTLGVSIAIAGVLIGYFLSKQFWTPALVTFGVGFVVCYAIITAAIFPNRDRRLAYVEFAMGLRSDVEPSQPICLYGMKEDPLVYYLTGRVRRAESKTDLLEALSGQDPLLIVSETRQLSELTLRGYDIVPSALSEQNFGTNPPLSVVRIVPKAVATHQR